MGPETRRLQDLISVGPAMLRDFDLLGIRSVAQLARRDPRRMYETICERTGKVRDICCLDVYQAAVAQARHPHLPAEKRQWWYWSRQRKAKGGASSTVERGRAE
jgi:CHAD domain-containing protein